MNDKEILYEILNSESESLTLAQIEGILDEELDKSPEEMDEDLVELCIEALTSADVKQLNKSKHRVTLAKILVAAVIFVVMIGVSIPACAKFFNIDVPEGIVSIYKDCFNVDISNSDSVDDIIGRLEQDGIENVVLPKIVFSDDTKIYNYRVKNNSNSQSVIFYVSNYELNGYIIIDNNNSSYDFFDERNKIESKFEQIKYINSNNVSVIIFYDNEYSNIKYIIEDIEYNINLDCDFETACKIAETI